MIPSDKGELLSVKFLVDLRFYPLRSLGACVVGGGEAGEGVRDGEVVRVGVPLARQVAAHLLERQVGVQVQDQHGGGRHRDRERLHLALGGEGFQVDKGGLVVRHGRVEAGRVEKTRGGGVA